MRIPKSVAAMVLLANVSCMTVQSVPAPKAYIPSNQPSVVWVTRSDNTVLALEKARVLGDTLAGFVEGEFHELSFAEVRRVSARRIDRARTALFVGALGLSALLIGSKLWGNGPPDTMPRDLDDYLAPVLNAR
jgi:hypothetical protein